MSDAPEYSYRWMKGGLVDGELLDELAVLYSAHYGTWGKNAPHSYRRIRLSAARLRDWLISPESRLAYATADGVVVGYAIAVQPTLPGLGVISWVTQLVVHQDHRRVNVGKRLLFSIWGFSNHYAWGLVTPNPYAVRALEKATRRRCDPVWIARNGERLAEVGRAHVRYLQGVEEWVLDSHNSRVDSKFYVDHSELPYMLEDVQSPEVPWTIGDLPEGWEWLAFTFQRQPEIELSREELETMVRTSDEVAKVAYSRMRLTASHRWAQHTPAEVALIVNECKIGPLSSVLDLGCGTGRHVKGLSKHVSRAVGVDYLGDSIAALQAEAGKPKNVEFVEGDVRDADLGPSFDAVLCLYDVIGSYADDAENDRIIQTIRRHLKPGGRALVSVMNFELTLKRGRSFFDFRKEPQRLLELPASTAMETSGNVFDPDYYMIDENSEIVYRKEQFKEGEILPAELLVRDRRYRRRDIEAKCYSAGLHVLWSRYVRAGQWEIELEADDDNAKEILLLCEARE